MADQLKLQAAPLAALQLELNQARLDTESMRTRLREDRKDARHRCAVCNTNGANPEKKICISCAVRSHTNNSSWGPEKGAVICLDGLPFDKCENA